MKGTCCGRCEVSVKQGFLSSSRVLTWSAFATWIPARKNDRTTSICIRTPQSERLQSILCQTIPSACAVASDTRHMTPFPVAGSSTHWPPNLPLLVAVRFNGDDYYAAHHGQLKATSSTHEFTAVYHETFGNSWILLAGLTSTTLLFPWAILVRFDNADTSDFQN